MSTAITLLPTPRTLQRANGTFRYPPCCYIALDPQRHVELLHAARTIQAAVRAATGHTWQIITAGGSPAQGIVVTLAVERALQPDQRYQVDIRADGIALSGADLCGAWYAAQTLIQLIRQFPAALPCLFIDDFPDFPTRGVMLDISRDKVPTMQTLYHLIDELAELKINQLQLYTEHTFAYRAHPQVWAQASPITGEEILAVDAYCRERFIDLVPNQNSFGHMERWLRLPRYAPLAESPNGSDLPWGGRWEGPAGLCPGDPRSLELISGLYDELLPHFTSRFFNVGCDETWDLGQGRSKADCESRGTTRVYLDFLLKVYNLVQSHGRTMQFWGDIIIKKPELIPELPADGTLIALEWGYHANHPFDEHGAKFAASGIPFYVCPGTSTWQTFAGRTDNALANLRRAAESGKKHGAIGYLNTDWGDFGHLQYLPISYLGFAAGAAYSWCLDTNRDLDLPAALNIHIFKDRANLAGQLFCNWGNAYLASGKVLFNADALFRLIVPPAKPIPPEEQLTQQDLTANAAAIDSAVANLDDLRMNRPDAALILDELRNAIAMQRHAIRLARQRFNPSAAEWPALATEMRHIIAQHRRLWLARNRVGGLSESVAHLEKCLSEYEEKMNAETQRTQS